MDKDSLPPTVDLLLALRPRIERMRLTRAESLLRGICLVSYAVFLVAVLGHGLGAPHEREAGLSGLAIGAFVCTVASGLSWVTMLLLQGFAPLWNWRKLAGKEFDERCFCEERLIRMLVHFPATRLLETSKRLLREADLTAQRGRIEAAIAAIAGAATALMRDEQYSVLGVITAADVALLAAAAVVGTTLGGLLLLAKASEFRRLACVLEMAAARDRHGVPREERAEKATTQAESHAVAPPP